MKHLLLVVGLAALAMGGAGCLPESDQPLSPPEQAAYDARLQGVWRATTNEAVNYLHFGRMEGASASIVSVAHEKDGGLSTSEYRMFSSVIGGVSYMNVQEKGAKAEEPKYLFVRYALPDPRTLDLWLVSDPKVERLIESGALKGVVSTGQFHTVRITDSTSNLVRIVRSAKPDELFDFFGRYERVP